jgi:hypothetical protein
MLKNDASSSFGWAAFLLILIINKKNKKSSFYYDQLALLERSADHDKNPPAGPPPTFGRRASRARRQLYKPRVRTKSVQYEIRRVRVRH